MKALLISLAAGLTVCALMLMPGTADKVAADEGDCVDIGYLGTLPQPLDVLNMPDQILPFFDFVEACDIHDACYVEGTHPQQTRPGMYADRLSCDQEMLGNMRASCIETSQDDPLLRFACNRVATSYYTSMRLNGYLYFSWCKIC